MAMSRSDFNNALREAVSSEFTDIPTDESSINYTISERFIKKMDKLIRSQKKVYYNFINTVSKRVAIICLVVVTLFTTACSVKAIREPIVNFITEVYETFTRYFFDGDTVESVTKQYSIELLPESFEQTNVTENDISVTKTYENSLGERIIFSQTITEDTEYKMDAEHGNVQKLLVNNIEVHIIMTDDIAQAIWIQDEYLLKITYLGKTDQETIVSMIESVK